MSSPIRKYALRGVLALVMISLAVLVSCSKNNPAPPPVVTSPAPGYGYGAGCGATGGTPLRADNPTLYGILTRSGGYGFTGSNTLQLNVFNLNNYAASSTLNVVGSGMFNFADLSTMNSYYGQMGSQPVSTSFCVSSMNPQGGQPIPGIYSPSSGQVALSLQGMAQTPMYSPYGSYPGSYGNYSTGQTLVRVSVGSTAGNCVAYLDLNQGRIYGCVYVTVGTTSYPLMYQSR